MSLILEEAASLPHTNRIYSLPLGSDNSDSCGIMLLGLMRDTHEP
jgi:hypothetical protein